MRACKKHWWKIVERKADLETLSCVKCGVTKTRRPWAKKKRKPATKREKAIREFYEVRTYHRALDDEFAKKVEEPKPFKYSDLWK